jgi:hypothetical protein
VYGSIHGCVDFLFVAQVIFLSFLRLFLLDFVLWLVPSISRCLGSVFLMGVMDRWLVYLCS